MIKFKLLVSVLIACSVLAGLNRYFLPHTYDSASESPETPALVENVEKQSKPCALSDAQQRELHQIFDTPEGVFQRRMASVGIEQDNYPRVLYNAQLETSSLLEYADTCRDQLMMEKLAAMYLQSLKYLHGSETGNMMWLHIERDRQGPDPTVIKAKHEVILDSSQFLFALSRLYRIIAQSDSVGPSLLSYMENVGPVIRNHYNRWIFGEPSVWIWAECGLPTGISNSRKAYNYSEFIKTKIAKKLNRHPRAPMYCNRMADIDLLAGAGVAEFYLGASRQTDIAKATINPVEQQHYVEFVQDVITLFESRTKTKAVSKQDCGGCEYLEVDPNGMRDHRMYRATSELWEHENTAWDISHARRIPLVMKTFYSSPEIFTTVNTGDHLSRLLANALAYQVFNGDFENPVFANYLNGVDGVYSSGSIGAEVVPASHFSPRYFNSDYGSLSNYSAVLERLHLSMLTGFQQIRIEDPENRDGRLPIGILNTNDSRRDSRYAMFLASMANSQGLRKVNSSNKSRLPP